MTQADDRADLEGFLAGVQHALARRRADGRPIEGGEARWSAARAALSSGDLAQARAQLVAIDEEIEGSEPETELQDHPRGLVSYVPKGSKGVPPPREEEPVANRLLLVQRLLEVRRASGVPVDDLIGALQRAEEAYRRGDRAEARRLTDNVHQILEEREPGRPGDPTVPRQG